MFERPFESIEELYLEERAYGMDPDYDPVPDDLYGDFYGNFDGEVPF